MTTDLHGSETLIKFPCDYKLKAMGKVSDTFIDTIFTITKKYAPDITKNSISLNNSKKKNFISVNILFHATCIEQIHGIYAELKEHPEVLMTL
jgi:putative lipoic acid-binding regulatory protein